MSSAIFSYKSFSFAIVAYKSYRSFDAILRFLEPIVAEAFITKGFKDFSRYRSIQLGCKQLSSCLFRVSQPLSLGFEQGLTKLDMAEVPNRRAYCALPRLTSRRGRHLWHMCMYSQKDLYWGTLPHPRLNSFAESNHSLSFKERIVLNIQSD